MSVLVLSACRKSQLAIEYGYRVRERSPDIWILWIHAGSTARVEQSYHDIADILRIPGRNEPKIDVLALVHKWLRNENNGKWLLIVDNIDDSYMETSMWSVKEALERAADEPSNTKQKRDAFYAYIPQSENGSVLVTTRNRGLATRMVDEHEIIEIEPMLEERSNSSIHEEAAKGREQRRYRKIIGSVGVYASCNRAGSSIYLSENAALFGQKIP